MTITTFKPSLYQEAIFDFVSNGSGNGFVEAVAGSGKTSTLKMLSERIKTNGLFAAFDTHIAQELKTSLPRNMKASTIHAIGLRAINYHIKKPMGDCTIDGFKYDKLGAQAVKGMKFEKQEDQKELIKGIVALLRYSRSLLVETESKVKLLDIIAKYGIIIRPEFLEKALELTNSIAYYGFTQARDKKYIDFTDMLWVPYRMRLELPKYPWVLIDEAQDLTPAQRWAVMQSSSGRMLWVGDRSQAIYGFTGADTDSVNQIIEISKAKLLPLSICYRCPKSHVELAKKLVPQIEASEWAIEGLIERIKEHQVPGMVKDGDMILCSVTAPLVEMCFRILKRGIPARVRGKAIGDDLTNMMTRICNAFDDFRMDRFIEAARWVEDEYIKVIGDTIGADEKISDTKDRIKCLCTIYNIKRPSSIEEFSASINGIFSEERIGVMLSTVHRAKGLEAPRVFILNPELMPHPNAKASWELAQERDLQYVAYTRAKEELYFVESEQTNERPKVSKTS